MFLDPLFKMMSEKQASDLFFTAGAPIMVKITGQTIPVNTQILDAATVRRVAYEAMSEAQVREFEERLELNFSIGVQDIGSFRVNVFRQRGAVAMVIRYVKQNIPTIDELRLPPVLRDIVMEKRGLVLVCGSTGSGKSSTLAAMINHRNENRTGHILTIEDPIEFIYKHRKSIVNQREVGMDTRSYHDALRNAMREAPDMILIGEIRDQETFQHALTYAQTGHLCLSTIHANNSYYCLNRVINFFPHEARQSLLMDLSVSLRAVISQRLVKDKQGRLVPAVEVLINTKHIQELIKNGEIDQIKEAMEQSLAPGCQTFEQCLHHLYKSGVVTLEDALANADSQTNLSWIIDNDAKAGEEVKKRVGNERTTAGDDLSSITLNL
jgi:twitching motility protein PilU